MLNIKIITVPHKKQRYDTVGDWRRKNGTDYIVVSDLGNAKMEVMVAIHELVEKVLCDHNGISEKAVDDFDMAYEKYSIAGDPDFQGEPGDDPDCPYRNEHCFATAVERMLCAAFGISWVEYEARINGLKR